MARKDPKRISKLESGGWGRTKFAPKTLFWGFAALNLSHPTAKTRFQMRSGQIAPMASIILPTNDFATPLMEPRRTVRTSPASGRNKGNKGASQILNKGGTQTKGPPRFLIFCDGSLGRLRNKGATQIFDFL
jgi:hypothetical protein